MGHAVPCAAFKQSGVLQALPLRLLERVAPWLACQASAADIAALMHPAPQDGSRSQDGSDRVDAVLAQLVATWAQRADDGPAVGHQHAPEAGRTGGLDMHAAFPTVTCAPQVPYLLSGLWHCLARQVYAHHGPMHMSLLHLR